MEEINAERWGVIIETALKETFKFDSFRHPQRNIILSILSGDY